MGGEIPVLQEIKLSEQFRMRLYLFMAAILICFIAYGSGLFNLYERWVKQDEYSHGFFIPLITVWMLWDRRVAIMNSMGKPYWVGLFLILVAATMLIVGELSAIYIMIQSGFILSLVGIILVFGGKPLLKITILPVIFLIFAIPLPYFLDTILSWRLQLISSQLGVFFIRLFDISVFLEGNVIDLGIYKLQVVEACSGLRYLFPLTSLGFLIAYLFKAPLWQRTIIFVSTVPITIVMNSFRIGMIGVAVDNWGVGMADGMLHYFEGWVIFMACAALLYLELLLFTKLDKQGSFYDRFGLPEITAAEVSVEDKEKTSLWLVMSIVALCAAMITAFYVSGRGELIPDRQRFVSFPDEMNEWTSRRSYLEPSIEKFLGVEDYILADYRHPRESIINLYVAYYSSQRKGVSPHSPRVCIPGGGWLITEFDRIYVESGKAGQLLPLNRALIERESDKQLVYYWFDQRGRKMSNEYLMKWHLLRDSIVINRTDGALVRLTTPVFKGETIQIAEDRLKSFVKIVVSNLPDYIPE